MNNQALALNIENYIRNQIADSVDQQNVKHIAKSINDLVIRWKQYREEIQRSFIDMDGFKDFIGEENYNALSKNKKLQIEAIAQKRGKFLLGEVKKAEKYFDTIFDQFGHYEDDFFEELETLENQTQTI